MSYLSNTIIEQAGYWAEKWQDGECKSVKNNRGNCIDEIKKQFSKEILGTPWCAEFVSVCVKTACDKLGITNLLPYTRSTAAMLSGSEKNGLTVDSTPKIGSVFYRTRSGGGHVGIVVKITALGIATIEGNSNDAVLARSYSSSEYKNWKFIHTEDMQGGNILKYVFRDGVTLPMYMLGGVGALVGAAYYANKYHHILPPELGINDEFRQ